MSRGERRLGLDPSDGRPAGGWSSERLVELVVLERWRSWLVVRFIATAFGPLLLQRRVGAWHWRIFLLGRRRWRSMSQMSLTQDCDRLRWQVALAANGLICFHCDRRRRAAVAAVATVAAPHLQMRWLSLRLSREQSHSRFGAVEPSRSLATAESQSGRSRAAAEP